MASRYIFVNLGNAWQAAANGKANSGITLYGFSAQIWQVRIMVECLEACTQGSTADIRGYESEMRKRILNITKYIATHKRKRDLSSERSQADWFDGCCHINDVTAEIRAKKPNKGLRMWGLLLVKMTLQILLSFTPTNSECVILSRCLSTTCAWGGMVWHKVHTYSFRLAHLRNLRD